MNKIKKLTLAVLAAFSLVAPQQAAAMDSGHNVFSTGRMVTISVGAFLAGAGLVYCWHRYQDHRRAAQALRLGNQALQGFAIVDDLFRAPARQGILERWQAIPQAEINHPGIDGRLRTEELDAGKKRELDLIEKKYNELAELLSHKVLSSEDIKIALTINDKKYILTPGETLDIKEIKAALSTKGLDDIMAARTELSDACNFLKHIVQQHEDKKDKPEVLECQVCYVADEDVKAYDCSVCGTSEKPGISILCTRCFYADRARCLLCREAINLGEESDHE